MADAMRTYCLRTMFIATTVVALAMHVGIQARDTDMGWKKGPLPPKTYDWGAVQVVGQSRQSFNFADFCGDHVVLAFSNEVIQADEVAWYNNNLRHPFDRRYKR